MCCESKSFNSNVLFPQLCMIFMVNDAIQPREIYQSFLIFRLQHVQIKGFCAIPFFRSHYTMYIIVCCLNFTRTSMTMPSHILEWIWKKENIPGCQGNPNIHLVFGLRQRYPDKDQTTVHIRYTIGLPQDCSSIDSQLSTQCCYRTAIIPEPLAFH